MTLIRTLRVQPRSGAIDCYPLQFRLRALRADLLYWTTWAGHGSLKTIIEDKPLTRYAV